MAERHRPLAVVNSVAPIRICDNGCWTDTWFAGHGQVFNVAVYPYAEVQVFVHRAGGGPPGDRIVLHPENFGERYAVRREAPPWGPHPLLEAAIAYMKVPKDLRVEVTIHSEAPAGAADLAMTKAMMSTNACSNRGMTAQSFVTASSATPSIRSE